jgi:hypothetical protein
VNRTIVKRCFLWTHNLMILPIKMIKSSKENRVEVQLEDLKK